MDQLRLIGGGHDDETGQVRKKGDVETARMGGTIGPNQPRTVDGETHGQALDRHIMHDLIIAAL